MNFDKTREKALKESNCWMLGVLAIDEQKYPNVGQTEEPITPQKMELEYITT
jgi:hypothetical protein